MYSVYLDFLALSKEEQKEFLEKIKTNSKQNGGNKSRTKTRRKSRQMKG
jgi:hypothetical protein